MELATPDHHRAAPPALPRYFDPESLDALEEPVQRYLNHALAPGTVVADGRRLSMAGRIKVGAWLAFDAEQEMSGDGHAFTWTARAGLGAHRPSTDHRRAKQKDSRRVVMEADGAARRV
jgi:hypothetical protein